MTALFMLFVAGSASATVVTSWTPVTGADVQRECERLEPCLGDTGNERLAGFCGLAMNGEREAKVWLGTPVPAYAELRDAACSKKAGPKPAAAPGAGAVATGLFGLNQSATIWGATDFMLSRAEAELREWAVDRFLAEICDGDLSTLAGEKIFRKGCEVIRGAHLAGFLAGMSTYQAAIREDLGHLPVLAAKAAAQKAAEASEAVGKEWPAKAKAYDHRRDALLVGMELAAAAEAQLQGVAPVVSLGYAARGMKGTNLDCGKVPVASRLFELSALLGSLEVDSSSGSPVIQIPSTDEGWMYAVLALAINARDPASPVAEAWPRNCEVGEPKLPVDVGVILGGKAQLKKALDVAKAASDALKGIPADASAAVRAERYGRASALVVQGARSLLEIFPKVSRENPHLVAVLQGTEEICRQLAGGNYAGMALGAASLATSLSDDQEKPLLPSEFLRLASFAADIGQAGTADEAAAAIERFAAPVGAYRIKRTPGRWYAGLNGYVGFQAAAEAARQATGGWSRAEWGFTPSLWAPIGLEGGYAGQCGTIGVLLQAVDLGALASWRISASKDDVQSRPDVGSDQVFSPGVAVVYGLKGAPFSAGLSASVTPKLRVLKTDSPGPDARDAWRVGAFFAVDVPIFP